LSFIQPRPDETILDAGCGSGMNIERLHSKVRRIIAIDFSRGSVERARERTRLHKMDSVEVIQGNIIDIPLPSCSVDKVLCMSVLQYLGDGDVRRAFAEFRRIVRPGGIVILHVKNISSIYLSTLYLMKKAKSMFRSGVGMEYYRSYRWYFRELELLGFKVTDYNSFNILTFEGMPRYLKRCLEKYELSNYNSWLLRRGFVRRHGSELKIKAQLVRRLNCAAA
jgi:ubiquinone/menaquinone biosynthesis C-methylase UbiE